MILKAYNIDVPITPGVMPPVIHIGQYVSACQYICHLKNDDGTDYIIPSNTTATFTGCNPRREVFDLEATVDTGANTISIIPRDEATSMWGMYGATLNLFHGDDRLTPIVIKMDVQKAGATDEEIAGAANFPDAVTEAVNDWLEDNNVFVGINNQIAAVQAAVSEAQAAVSEAQAAVSEAQADISEAAGTIVSLSGDLAAAQQDIADLGETAKELNLRFWAPDGTTFPTTTNPLTGYRLKGDGGYEASTGSEIIRYIIPPESLLYLRLKKEAGHGAVYQFGYYDNAPKVGYMLGTPGVEAVEGPVQAPALPAGSSATMYLFVSQLQNQGSTANPNIVSLAEYLPAAFDAAQQNIADLEETTKDLDLRFWEIGETPNAARANLTGQKLTATGATASETGSEILCLRVTPGAMLRLRIAKVATHGATYQFGHTDNGPKTNYLVGTPYTEAVDGVIQAPALPQGASNLYLFVSQLQNQAGQERPNIVAYTQYVPEKLAEGVAAAQADIAVMQGEIAEIQGKFDVPGALLPMSIRANKGMSNTGGGRDDADRDSFVFQVTPGDTLFVDLERDANTPADEGILGFFSGDGANANTRIGNVITTAIRGLVTVPVGAVSMVVSQPHIRDIVVARPADRFRKLRTPLWRGKIGTFNVGHFCLGVNEKAGGLVNYNAEVAAVTAARIPLFRDILRKADIWGLQEDDLRFYSEDTPDSPRDLIYAGFKFYETSGKNSYSCESILAQRPIYRFVSKQFTVQDGGPRRYVIGQIELADGEYLTIISTQLSWNNLSVRRQNIAELITIAKRYKRVIVMGDMNPQNYDRDPYDPSVYRTDYAMWTDAGFVAFNCGWLGEMNTIPMWNNDPTNPRAWDTGFAFPADLFQVINVEVIPADGVSDHHAVVTELCIY